MNKRELEIKCMKLDNKISTLHHKDYELRVVDPYNNRYERELWLCYSRLFALQGWRLTATMLISMNRGVCLFFVEGGIWLGG